MAVIDVTVDDWERTVLQSDTLVLVDYWHERCIWCKRLDPIYSELAEDYQDRLKFVKSDILSSDENRKMAITYGVMGTPTLIFFCAGRPVGTAVGFQPKDRLKQLIDDMIDKHQECITQSTELNTG